MERETNGLSNMSMVAMMDHARWIPPTSQGQNTMISSTQSCATHGESTSSLPTSSGSPHFPYLGVMSTSPETTLSVAIISASPSVRSTDNDPKTPASHTDKLKGKQQDTLISPEQRLVTSIMTTFGQRFTTFVMGQGPPLTAFEQIAFNKLLDAKRTIYSERNNCMKSNTAYMCIRKETLNRDDPFGEVVIRQRILKCIKSGDEEPPLNAFEQAAFNSCVDTLRDEYHVVNCHSSRVNDSTHLVIDHEKCIDMTDELPYASRKRGSISVSEEAEASSSVEHIDSDNNSEHVLILHGRSTLCGDTKRQRIIAMNDISRGVAFNNTLSINTNTNTNTNDASMLDDQHLLLPLPLSLSSLPISPVARATSPTSSYRVIETPLLAYQEHSTSGGVVEQCRDEPSDSSRGRGADSADEEEDEYDENDNGDDGDHFFERNNEKEVDNNDNDSNDKDGKYDAEMNADHQDGLIANVNKNINHQAQHQSAQEEQVVPAPDNSAQQQSSVFRLWRWLWRS